MKKSKSILSVVLCAIMLFSCCALYPSADSAGIYPESEHNYRNNSYNEWVYTHPTEAEGLYITFSDDTRTESGEYYSIYFDEDEDVKLEDLIEMGGYYKEGDYISIFDGNDELFNVFQGDELSGATVYIPGSSFKLSLTTDSTITNYGFKVVDVQTQPPVDSIILRFHLKNGETHIKFLDSDFNSDYNLYRLYSALDDFDGYVADGEAVIGWEIGETEDVIYYNNPMYFDILYGDFADRFESGSYDFCAITTPVVLEPKDVYSFRNTFGYFDYDGDRYYMTKENYLRLITSSCIVNGVGPLALPAAVTSLVLITYADWPWNGSCIGFTSTVCQQKAGVLDVVATQPGATCINDLEPTPELVSLLNYYNGQSFTSALTKNKALKSNEKEYSRQLKKMFESAEQGNLVLLEFFTGDRVIEGYHGLAVAGAYTDPDGRHVMLCYDSNYEDCISRKCYISPDFTSLDTGYYEGLGFVWTDDFESYRSLDINKVTSPAAYNVSLIRHFFEIIKEWFEHYILGIFR